MQDSRLIFYHAADVTGPPEYREQLPHPCFVLRSADPPGGPQPAREIPGTGNRLWPPSRPHHRGRSLCGAPGPRFPRFTGANETNGRDVRPARFGLCLFDLWHVPLPERGDGAQRLSGGCAHQSDRVWDGPGRWTGTRMPPVRDRPTAQLPRSDERHGPLDRRTQIGAFPRIGVDYAGPWAAKPWRFRILATPTGRRKTPRP